MTSHLPHRKSRATGPGPWIVVVAAALLSSLTPLAAQDATLTVVKQVSPVVDGTVFPFTIEGEASVASFDLRGNSLQQITLAPGTYVVREAISEPWELSLLRCGDVYGVNIYEVGPVASGAVRLALEPGEEAYCQFHNSRTDLPPWPAPGPAPEQSIPTLSPTALSILVLTLSVLGALLLRRSL